MWPSSIKKEVTNDQNHVLFQAWHENGEYCPEGTIPIVRTPKSNYPQKVPLVSRMNTNDPLSNGHEVRTFLFFSFFFLDFNMKKKL